MTVRRRNHDFFRGGVLEPHRQGTNPRKARGPETSRQMVYARAMDVLWAYQNNNGGWTCLAPLGIYATYGPTNIVGQGMTGISVSLNAC